MVDNSLLDALHSTKRVIGLTHNFYRYPARMSPDLASEVIQLFSNVGDVIFDPFMGGGTSIVEALAAGRHAIGVDINPISLFVTAVKTTPLSFGDETKIKQWANEIEATISAYENTQVIENDIRTKNLPEPVQKAFLPLLNSVDLLPQPRQRQFIRCVLLRLGQWAIDCKTIFPTTKMLIEKLHLFLDEMLQGLDKFVSELQQQGIAKNKITSRRTLLLRSIVDVHNDYRLRTFQGKPKLVITSPPYPGVHILYHRWQVESRRETPAPYWLIDAQDGNRPSYYTFGGRSKLGVQEYFRNIVAAYSSVREIIHPEALVVQLIAFSNIGDQLPEYLKAMELAGYCQDKSIAKDYTELWRRVPNRKWYNNTSTANSQGLEVLLFHRPSTSSH
jgi:hypothetical protein